VNIKDKEPTLARESEVDGVPVPENWEQVIEMAWRPAWSIRSRKGCLAPFITWWKRRVAVRESARPN